MRHPIIDKILTEWSYRVHDGMPNPKNPMHLIQLRESLKHLRRKQTLYEISNGIELWYDERYYRKVINEFNR